MSLPFIFANQTQPNLTWLDANFAAVGALCTIPCAISGTNALTLIQAANTPAISAYANYLRLSGVVASGNSGPTTVQLESLAALPVYKDTVAGPVLLTGGELWAGNAVTFVYNSALGSGSGGFHIQALASGGGGSGTVTSVVGNNGLTGTVTTSGNIGLASIANLRILANVSGGAAVPTAQSLSAIMDAVFGTTRGAVLYRGATVWSALAPGTSGTKLTSNGAGADPTWT